MARKYLIYLATSFLLFSGCAGLPTTEQVSEWRTKTDKVIASVSTAVEKGKQALDTLEAKYAAAVAKMAEMQATQAALLASVEGITGTPLDADGDGDVTVAEAKAAIGKLSASPEGQTLLKDPVFWVSIFGAIAGVGVGKKTVVNPLIKAFHKTGRNLAGPSNGNSA